MSIGRHLFNELRPIFRMLEEPLSRGALYGVPTRAGDPFNNPISRPAVDVTEKGDKYILDADLPGFKKENLEIWIGEGGDSITIEGKVVDHGRRKASKDKETSDSASSEQSKSDSTAVTKKEESTNQISAERPSNFSRNLSFTRTVWLPRPVDSKDVSAKLDHGVLTIILKKAKTDKHSSIIPID